MLNINDVVTVLNLERDPKTANNTVSFNVRCPFCGDTKYHLNINTQKNSYHCVRCGDQKGTGMFDLYARCVFGERYIKGANGNGEKIKQALAQAVYGEAPRRPLAVNQVKKPEVVAVHRAPDAVVDETYSKLLATPGLELVTKHREDLHRRGLDDDTIDRNQYRSIENNYSKLSEYSQYAQIFKQEHLREICDSSELLKGKSNQQLIAGLTIAQRLANQGCTLDGVPGFYKIGAYWAFHVEPGMIIPTRNQKGEIVAIQTRKDSGNLRYMTLSSKGLPCGVSENISRTHFPLMNVDELNSDTKVYLTEGPLKADVALALMHKLGYSNNIWFIAVPGVLNTRELPEIFEMLKENGISKVTNAFDMDKTTNPYVAKAGRNIRAMAGEHGLQMDVLCWGEDDAELKMEELTHICLQHGIVPPTTTGNIFVDIGAMAEKLNAKQIQFGITASNNKKAEKNYWCPASKGIDDYLLLLTKQAQS